ncbi:S9 family peptidase [uncultured Dokdonia sp.]|uniref:S9 family peptidase n=1 Tax=uncultured Dokdonia sp. TaxID=575653 RepID=UPI00260D6C45|nr:S9 family peptidase [uncultured Dokdonia sp.]
MKKAFVLIVGICMVSFYSCKKEKKEDVSVTKVIEQYTIEQFMDNESAWANGFSTDNSKVLITSNRSGINNIYTIPAKGGELTPITQSDSSSIYGISYFPKDDRILFRMDGNGDEVYKIFVKDGNDIKALTPLENVRTAFRGWSKDGERFFYGSNERDPQFLDHYEMNMNDYTSKLVYKVENARDFNAMSDDGKYITLSEAINTNDSDLYIVNTETKEQKKVNSEQSSNSHLDFSPDGKSLYFSTDAGAENTYVARYDIATGTTERITNNTWEVLSYYFSFNGTYNVFYTNEDAKTVLRVTEVATGKTIDFPEIDGQSIAGVRFSRDETMAILEVSSSAKPSDTYSYNMQTKEYYQLTDVLNQEIDPADLVEGKVVRFKSFDGVEIPAIYFQPKQANANNKVPALVQVHGGPGGQSTLRFSSNVQYLVNHGYAVLAVNNRGSSGYGKTFYQMDNQNHGDKDLKDCIAGKNWLAQQDVIDADKIGIMGGSYGGFMTMAALTAAPEEFKVGVNYFGVTNWVRTLKSIPPWWASFKDALYDEMGDPNTADSIRLKQISPLFHTDKVTKPLLVLQGAQDPRVLQVESDEIVEGVRKNGVPVEYVLFEDEGHGFVKKENQIEASKKVKEFLDQYLKGSTNTLEKTDL